MSLCQSVCYMLELYVWFQYNVKIIDVNIVFASFAGLLNVDFVLTAYRRTFHSGKQFFNLFSTHPLKMSNPFRSVLMSQTHICHWSLIVILICIFIFVIFNNNYFVHANRMQIASYSNLVFVCFVNSKNSWMGKGHQNFIYMLNAHRILYICKFTVYIAYNETKIVFFYAIVRYTLYPICYFIPNAECTRAN